MMAHHHRPSSRALSAVALAFSVVTGLACGSGDPCAGAPDVVGPAAAASVPVGVVVIPPNYEATEAGFGAVVDVAEAAGATLLSFGYAQWSAQEPSSGTYDLSDFDPFFAVAENRGFTYVWDVSTPIGPAGLDVPADLAFVDFDDPTIRSRYAAYLEAVAAAAPPAVTHFTLHVEGSSEYFAEHPDQQDGFCGFMESAVAALRAARPGARIGTYWRYEDVDDLDLMRCATGAGDYLGLAFILNPPGDTLDDVGPLLDDWLDRTDQPIAIVEAGWPSSDRFQSDATCQAAYVSGVFRAVEDRAARMEFVSYYTAFDEDEAFAMTWIEASFPDMPRGAQRDLAGWVGSLGLLTASGEQKSSFDSFERAISGP